MRKYIYFAYMSLQRQFMNRFDMMIVLVTTLVSFLCQYFVWKYCFRNNPEQIVYMTKYVLVSSFLFIILNNDIALDESDQIQTGEFITYLVKPMNSLLAMWAKDFGEVLSRLLVSGIVVVIIFQFYIGWQTIAAAKICLFILFCVLGYIFSSLIYVNIGCLAFVFNSVKPFNSVMMYIILFFGGLYFPAEFYPENIKKIIEFLPFQYLYYYPINLLISGEKIEIDYILSGYSSLLFWSIFCMILFVIIYKKMLLKISTFGG